MAKVRWGRRVRLLAGLVLGAGVGAWSWHALQDARLRGAFREALAARPPSESAVPGEGGGGTPTSVRLTLVSFNVWALPVPLPGMDRVGRLPRIPAALAGMRPDLIVLQEAFDVRMKAFLADYFDAWHAGPRIRCREPMVPVGEKDCTGGLVTLSRLPILEEAFWVHPTGEDAKLDERNGRKGFQITTVETPLGPVDVVNVHLYAGRNEADEDHRLLQLAQLRAALDSTGSAGRPVILAGDLNVVHPALAVSDPERTPSRAYRYVVDSLGFADTRPEAVEGDLTYDVATNPYADLWYNRFEGRQVFDYVMVRVPEAMTFRVLRRERILDGDILSDHFGLFAEVELLRTR